MVDIGDVAFSHHSSLSEVDNQLRGRDK